MATSGIERRYARALWRCSQGGGDEAKALHQSLETVLELFNHQAAAKVLCSPVMPLDLKRSLLNLGLEKAGKTPMLERFLDSIVQAGRIALLPGIVDAFRQLIIKEAGIAEAMVESAVEMDGAQLDDVKKLFGQKQVELKTAINADLLGGFIVRSGNSLVDMSLKTKLDNLMHQAMV